MIRFRIQGLPSAVLLIVLSIAQTANFAAAQGAGATQLQRPSERELPSLPAPSATPAPAPLKTPLVLPPVPTRPGRPAGPTIVVTAYQFSGHTAFTDEELQTIAAPYRDTPITTEQLDELRRAVTDAYVQRGYINSGAVIPDQRLADQTVRIVIVEGVLTSIEVRGTTHLDDTFISERLKLASGPPLNVSGLQDRLQLLVGTTHIERVNADLQPGARPGEARLIVDIEEAPPASFQFILDNKVSPSVGGEQGRLLGEFRNFVGNGDRLNVEAAIADGLLNVSANYTYPLTPDDLEVRVFGEYSKSSVVLPPFNAIDVESKAESIGIELRKPFFRTSRQRLMLGASFERRRSQTFLLGRPFPFAVGVENDGESNVAVVRLTQDWLQQETDQVLAVRSTFSIGLNAFGATKNSTDIDGDFLAWLGQAQFAKRIQSTGGQIIARGSLQLANDPLMSLEQFAIGGASSLRGYRENQRIADNGYSAGIEYRHPVFKDEFERTAWRVAAFADYGDTWNRDRDAPDSRSLASIGLGVHWDPDPKYHAELYWGIPLRTVRNSGVDLQDSGFHFALSAALFQ